MSQSAQSIEQRRAKRLVSHIVWLQRHMPEAAALNHRVRELELLVSTDSCVAELVSQSKSTVQKKRASRSSLFPPFVSVQILEREANTEIRNLSAVSVYSTGNQFSATQVVA